MVAGRYLLGDGSEIRGQLRFLGRRFFTHHGQHALLDTRPVLHRHLFLGRVAPFGVQVGRNLVETRTQRGRRRFVVCHDLLEQAPRGGHRCLVLGTDLHPIQHPIQHTQLHGRKRAWVSESVCTATVPVRTKFAHLGEAIFGGGGVAGELRADSRELCGRGGETKCRERVRGN